MKTQPKSSIVKIGAVIAKLSGCGLFIIYLCGVACDGPHNGTHNPTPATTSLSVTFYLAKGPNTISTECTRPDTYFKINSTAGSEQDYTDPASDHDTPHSEPAIIEGGPDVWVCPAAAIFSDVNPGTWTVQANAGNWSGSCSVTVPDPRVLGVAVWMFSDGRPCRTLP